MAIEQSGTVKALGGLTTLVILGVALATCLDVLSRWLFNAPLSGLYELSGLVTAIAVCGCLQASLALDRHVSFSLLEQSVRDPRPIRASASVWTLGFVALLCWQVAAVASDHAAGGETSLILGVPTAPFWWLAAFFIALAVLVQGIVALSNIFALRKAIFVGNAGGWLLPTGSVAAALLLLWGLDSGTIADPLPQALAGLAALYALIVASVPIAVAMGVVGLFAFATLTTPAAAFSVLGSEATAVLSNMDLAAIPMFLLMGGFAIRAGLASDVFRLAFAFLGHRRGGLCYAAIASCGGFGAISGSSLATTATMGQTALGEMRERGYATSFISGTIAAGGTLGALIPPSIVLIVYAVLTDLPIRDLFIAAAVPGVVAVALYFLAVAVSVRMKPSLAPPSERHSREERWAALMGCWRAAALFIAVIGGLYGGVFTTHEAAAVGAGLAFAMALLSRRLTYKALFDLLLETTANTAMIYLIIIGANVFGYFIAITQFPQELGALITGAAVSPALAIFILIILYLILGSVFDTMAAMLVTVPFIAPLVVGLGYDPMWWGILTLVVVEVGMITPPIGMNVFVLKGVVGDSVDLGTIFQGVIPFLAADAVRIVLLALFPAFTLWLPRQFG